MSRSARRRPEPGAESCRLVRPLRLGLAKEVWLARAGQREVVVHRHLAAGPFPPPPPSEVLKALNHPHLVRFLWQFEESDGTLVQVFERLDGWTLAEVTPPIVKVLHGCLLALRWLHERCPIAPRVHGDISPSNIFWCTGGRVKLVDLLALRPGEYPVGPGVVFGTLVYLAPEILAGGPHLEAGDIWGLAASLLRVATGPFPWADASSPLEVSECLRHHQPWAMARALDLPQPVPDLLSRMLAPDPLERPRASDLLRWLRRSLASDL